MKTDGTDKKLKNISIFHKYDIILYVVCAALTVTLFCVFVFPSKTMENEGFRVLSGQSEIYSYIYGTYGGRQVINSEWKDKIEISDKQNGVFTVKIYTDTDKQGFNQLTVNDNEKTVRVSDSNCSTGKDCVYTPPLSDSGGAIICVPHNLKILPLGDGYIPPVTG